jgi:hypothetical protein
MIWSHRPEMRIGVVEQNLPDIPTATIQVTAAATADELAVAFN